MSKWILSMLLLGATSLSSLGFAYAVPDSTNGWGYGYDSLLKDLEIWRRNPHVKVDSLGVTAKGRALWMVSVTGEGDSLGLGGSSSQRKHRVFMHARTHPSEVQANYVANEAIRFLLDSTDESAELRAGYIFNIIPMYNPDGVEGGHPRENGNLVNLEVNWDVTQPEAEVIILRNLFESYMAGPIPVEVALNLHSDQYNFARFFWYHYAAGTSAAYTVLEKDYIGKVQSYFPGGIKNWDAMMSWDAVTGFRYPEGFWWKNYKESVLALTYEDINGPQAGKFDSTGRALVLGSVAYIRGRLLAGIKIVAGRDSRLKVERDGVRILAAIGSAQKKWSLTDLRGRHIAGGYLAHGENFLNWSTLSVKGGGILSVFSASELVLRVRL